MAEIAWEPPTLQEQMAQSSPPQHIVEKETGRPVEMVSDLVDSNADSEALAYMLGRLIEAMFDRRLLTAQEVLDITGTYRWYKAVDTPAPSNEGSET